MVYFIIDDYKQKSEVQDQNSEKSLKEKHGHEKVLSSDSIFPSQPGNQFQTRIDRVEPKGLYSVRSSTVLVSLHTLLC